MSESILGLVILILAVLLAVEKYVSHKERAKLINALISKNAEQLRDLDLADKLKMKENPPVPPEFVPLENLSDEEFEKVVTKET